MTCRRLLCIIFSLALLVPAWIPASAQARYGVISTPQLNGAVNLRARAGAAQSIIGWAANGDEVELLYQGRTWHRVRLLKNGRVGWVYGRYLRLSDADYASGEAGAHLSGSVAQIVTRYPLSLVNLREGPGISYPAAGKYGRGTRLEILEECGGWYRIAVAGTDEEGWMSSSYVRAGLAGITTGRVNLRRGAGTGCAVIRTLENHTPVTVIWVGEEWSRVEADGIGGYISNSYYSFR